LSPQISEGSAIVEASVLNGAVQLLRGVEDQPSLPSLGSRQTLFLCFLHNLLLYNTLIVEQEMGFREFLTEFHYVESDQLDNLSRVGSFFRDLGLDGIVHLERIESDHALERSTVASFARVFLSKLGRKEVPEIDLPFDYMSPRYAPPGWGGYHGPVTDMAENLAGAGLPPEYVGRAVFLYRALRYAGYAKQLSKHTEAPIAYSASPGRIVGLRYLLDARDTSFIEFCGNAYWELIERLSLPEGGYDYAEFANTFNPVLDSRLSYELMTMPPIDALHRVLELRNSAKGEALRSEWLGLVWDKKLGIAHGVANLNISHVHARDINQTVFIVGTAQEAQQMAKMRMKNMRLTGDAEQTATNVSTDMDMSDISARNAAQRMTYEGVDLNRLASELEQLHSFIEKMHPSAVDQAEIIDEARKHAEAGNGSLAKQALQRLGKWVTKIAVDAGTDLAEKFIERSMNG